MAALLAAALDCTIGPVPAVSFHAEAACWSSVARARRALAARLDDALDITLFATGGQAASSSIPCWPVASGALVGHLGAFELEWAA